jgi:aspartate-semialdehyde dehydrogenase
MARAGARIGVAGASGALGSEVLFALDASGIAVASLRPLGREDSEGLEVEFQGELYPVEAARGASLRGLDLLFLCAPAPASLELGREALRAGVPAIDLSGAFAGRSEVPLRVAAFEAEACGGEPAPLVAAAAGPALALALVLRPLAERAGLTRVVATLLDSASSGGRGGIEALHAESVALFNQKEAPAPEVFARPVAFDCLPAAGGAEPGGEAPREREVALALRRLLGAELRPAISAVQVPTFVGAAAALAVETERPQGPKQAADALAQAPGVELRGGPEGPTLRSAAGRAEVLVGRLRADPSLAGGRGLSLWLACDPLRLSAANAVALAAARLSRG